MSHANDGDLHAYLDGALASSDPERSERLAAHLEECSDCRVRLEEARALRSRAGEILASADIGSVLPPPFEEILERAETPRGFPLHASDPTRRSARWSRPPLAWAASVAVALGAGWLGHSVWTGTAVSDFEVQSLERSQLTQQAIDAAGPEARESSSRLTTRGGTEVDDAAGFGDRVANLEQEEEARAAGRTVARALSERQNRPAETEQPAAAPARAAPVGGELAPSDPEPSEQALAARLPVAPPQGAEANEAYRALRKDVADDSVVERRAADRDQASDERRAEVVMLDAAISGAAQPEPDVAGEAGGLDSKSSLGELVWLPVSRIDAEQWIGGSLLQVPDLEVSDLAISTRGTAHVVRIRQNLSGDETLELIQGLASSDEVGEVVDVVAAAGRMAGADQPGPATEEHESMVTLTVDRGGFRIMATAPVAIDSLRILLSRVR